MQRTRTVGNGEGSLYFSESQQKLIFQYVYNGKKKAIKQKKNELVRDFKARARKLKNELDNGTYIESSNITIYELGKQILDNKLNRNLIIPNTYTTSIQILDVIKKEIGNIKIQKATSFQLQDFIDSTTNYSNNYIGKIYAHLNAIFVEAMKQDLIIKNPMMKVDKVKSKKTDNKIESLTIEEQKKLLEQLKKEKALKPIFTIALYTGMRMGEILALEVNDIDFKNKEIHIQRTLTKNKNDKTILGTTTKTYAGNRIIPITSLFEKELKNFEN